MRKEKGITLVSLILTVAVLIIIVAVSLNVGSNSLDSTRLKGFYMQLEIVQKRVDDIAATNESYIDEDGDTIFLKEQGKSFDGMEEKQQEILTDIIESVGGDVLTGYIANFRYFTSQELENILGLSDIDYNMFIDFENRIIIAEQGIEIKGVKYHMLESTAYFIKNNPNKNVGSIDFSVSVSKYGSNKYKLTIMPGENIGDLQGTGIIKYKEITTNYWDTSRKMEIIVDEISKYYDIIYQDTKGNKSMQKTVGIVLEDDGIPNVAEVVKIYTSDQLLSIATEEKMVIATRENNEKNNQLFNMFGDFIQINEKRIIPTKQEYAANPTNENSKITKIYVLMNDIEFKLDEYWTPIGEAKIKDGKLDGNNKKITIIYTDADGEEYAVVYDESSNYKEKAYKVNIIPKLEDGTTAKNANILITYSDGRKIEKTTGATGEESIEILLQRETEEVVIEAWIEGNIYSTPITFKIENPNKINDICPVIKNALVTITVNPEPSDAIVTINGQNQKSIIVQTGTTINWTVSREHYITKSGSYTATAEGTQNVNVTLDPKMITFTVNPTPSDATVTLNGKTGKSITVQSGTTINWSVSREHYITQSNSYTASTEDSQSINVTLNPNMVTITVNPTPSDATVTINGQTRKSITVQSGSTINWTVSREHYYTQSNSYIANSNSSQTINVVLDPKMVTFTINPTPSDAIVTINGQVTNSLSVIECSTVTWSVKRTYYYEQTGSYTMGTTNYSIGVTLTQKPTQTLKVDASSATGSGSITSIEYAAAGSESNGSAWAWLGSDRTVTMHFSGFDNIDSNAKIVSMSAEFKIKATVSPYFNASLVAGSRTCGTYREEFTSVDAAKFTVTANNLPTGAEVKSGTALAVKFEKVAGALGYWYGSTLIIQYIQP